MLKLELLLNFCVAAMFFQTPCKAYFFWSIKIENINHTQLDCEGTQWNLIKLNFHQFYFLRLKDTLRSNVCCTRWVQRGKTGSYGGGLEAVAGPGRILFPGWGVLTDLTGEGDIWIFLFLMRQLETEANMTFSCFTVAPFFLEILMFTRF